MLKKSAIAGLVLLLVGAVAIERAYNRKRKEQQQLDLYKLKYCTETDAYLRQYNEWLQLTTEERAVVPWGLNESGKTKTEAQLQQEQKERLKADLDKLAAGETQIYPFADVLYGKNWQNEIKKYKSQKELRESVLTASIVCTSTGAMVFTWCILLWLARLLIKGLHRLQRLQTFFAVLDKPFTKLFASFLKNQGHTTSKNSAKAGVKKAKKNPELGQKSHEFKSQTENHSAGLMNLSWQNPDLASSSNNHIHNAKHRKKQQAAKSSETTEKIAVSLSDEKTTEPEQHLITPTKETNTLLNSSKNTLKLEESLKTQAENLEKQMAEFKQMAQTVQHTALEHSKPLNNAIKELTQQVSAIREYAAHQQDRVERLQDGYDWNIIKTFCLRVIRCVDNLENRISQLSEENVDTTNLEEIKDELLFALESSGVEQFEPEINSDYRGQEKFAEAIKDTQQCENPKQAGKIAKVIRPGYQYFINEDNVKIVRTAQVKLFG